MMPTQKIVLLLSIIPMYFMGSTFAWSIQPHYKEGSHQQGRSVPSLANIPKELRDKKHGIKMGIPYEACDNGQVNLKVDWDGCPSDYTCFGEKNLPYYDMNISSQICVIKPSYMPRHWCMMNPIVYDEPIPFYGDHRPLWPKFGEYEYIPPQRWLHSLEHGAIVFLYHPCARPEIVLRVKDILKSCLRKYIIAKNKHLDRFAPLLLLAWGCKYYMSGVNELDIVRFIRTNAMTAPESHTKRQGWYDWALLSESIDPPEGSDISESHICPSYPKYPLNHLPCN